MEYSQQQKIHDMIELIHQELVRAHKQGEPELRVIYVAADPDDTGVYIGTNASPENNISHVLGLSGGETLSLFKYVCREGYVGLSPGSDLSKSFNFVVVDHINRAGLIEIGALPDPRQHLLSGLEAALHEIQQDPTLEPEEKEEKLKLGREAIAFARGLAVELAAKVIVGG